MEKSENIRIGQEIRTYLENKGYVQSQVAEILQITQGAVSAYYRGKPIGKNSAKKWSEAFGFRENWLITGEGSMLLEEKSSQDAPIPEQTASNNSLIDYLQRKIAELESKVDKLNDEKAELLQENAILKYENTMLSPRKGDAEDAGSSSSASAV
jgi:transcriptional regulator with XRE-family HTH domain